MQNKILKIELLGLFLMAIIVVIYSYNSTSLPDNFYSISSENSGIGFMSYYFTTALTFLGRYTGLWVFFSFIVYLPLYTFVYSRRESKLDLYAVVSLCFFTLFLCRLFFESALGPGLNFYLENYSDIWVDIFAMSVAGAGLFYVTFRRMSFNFLKKQVRLSADLGRTLFNKIRIRKVAQVSKERMIDLKKTVSEFALLENAEQDEIKSSITDRVEIEPSRKEDIKKESRPVRPLSRGPRNDVTFKSSDLIATLADKQNKKKIKHPEEAYFRDIIESIEDKLIEFKIDARIINIMKGPVVDTFELELGSGVKVSKVNSITEDLSLALCGAPIRLVYPLTGKSTMGIEVPRNPREIIYLDEVLSSKEFMQTKKKLPICMGKDAYGETFVSDLASMPHMLIAGATGAGKSVFLNTLLVSLLIKRSPREMKLILIDPKQLELALYGELPHLISPVITDGKSASYALLWAVQEMERRYSILKEMGVRSIDTFNERLKTASKEKLSRFNKWYEGYEDSGYELPYLVIIVDEFADLILTKVGKEIENNICRLAAKARAAGIHLVLATQRPSVDVITGLIKSNFPTRVSFKVTTNIDSRTILSAQGAEKLLGMGDMLYKHGIEMKRLHSAYVDEIEIESLMEKFKEHPAHFDDRAMEFIENGGDTDQDDFAYSPAGQTDSKSTDDKIYNEAVKVIAEHKKASASFLQRRLSIGYNRAANLIEQMEEKGLVGPQQGSKPRDVFIGVKDL